MKWNVHNGRSVAFWRDKWLERQPPCELQLGSFNEEELGKSLNQYWDHQAGWRWGSFAYHLPATSLIKMASLRLEDDTLNKDRFVWGGEHFSVRAAYKPSMGWKDDDRWEGLNRIWKLGVQ